LENLEKPRSEHKLATDRKTKEEDVWKGFRFKRV
jgi:hypothetical protein